MCQLPLRKPVRHDRQLMSYTNMDKVSKQNIGVTLDIKSGRKALRRVRILRARKISCEQMIFSISFDIFSFSIPFVYCFFNSKKKSSQIPKYWQLNFV